MTLSHIHSEADGVMDGDGDGAAAEPRGHALDAQLQNCLPGTTSR